MSTADTVRIVEVGPRDGLQNESHHVPTAVKIKFIELLTDAGLRHIEATAFVSPKWVPQMADHTEVMRGIRRVPSVRYAALVPNLKGLEAALAVGIDEVAVFTSASESFSQKNINCSIEQSITRFRPVIDAARGAGVRVRGYVSCMFGCPYEGAVAPKVVATVARRLFAAGCYEISFGDTIGVGTPRQAADLFHAISDHVPLACLAGHFHDTYGQALANVYACLELGVRVFDASVSGLGGCPYAPGSAGNLATEDLLYCLNGIGLQTGVNMGNLIAAGRYIREHLGTEGRSRSASAMIQKNVK
jgi:hydroxymethylglutaryl-CoA lyase